MRMSDLPKSPGLSPIKNYTPNNKDQIGENNNNDLLLLSENVTLPNDDINRVTTILKPSEESTSCYPEFDDNIIISNVKLNNKINKETNGNDINKPQESNTQPALTFATIDEVPVHVMSELEMLNSWKSRDSVQSASSNRPIQPKMGKSALLRTRSISTATDDCCDVVQELVDERHGQKFKILKDKIKVKRHHRRSENLEDADASSTYSTGSSRMNNDDGSYCDDNQSIDFPDDNTTAEIASMHMLYDLCDTSNVSTIPEFDPVNFVRVAIGDVTVNSGYMDSLLNEPPTLPYSQSMSQIRRLSFLSSIKNGITKTWSFRSNVDQLSRRSRQRCQSFSPQITDSLENQLHVHSVQVCQASKAVDFCRSHLKEVTVPCYAEAEKVLLVASCYKDILSKTLNKNEIDDINLEYNISCGSIEISNLVFHQKSKIDIDENINLYYVVIVTHGVTVLSSEVLSYDKGADNKDLTIAKTFVLNNLNNDFDIAISIYSLEVEKYDEDDIQGKRKQCKKERKSPCPSTKSSFLSKFYKPKKKTLSMNDVSVMRTSMFKRVGACNLKLSDLGKNQLKISKEFRSSSLKSEFQIKFKSSVEVTCTKKGIFSIGGALKWNLRYCVLEGHLLKYWNYPEEEFTKEPLGIIDLSNAAGQVTLADRSKCSRPRCLSLQLCSNEQGILQYYLCFDNLEEKNDWMKEINFVIGTLDAWNCLNQKQFLITSL